MACCTCEVAACFDKRRVIATIHRYLVKVPFCRLAKHLEVIVRLVELNSFERAEVPIACVNPFEDDRRLEAANSRGGMELRDRKLVHRDVVVMVLFRLHVCATIV